MKYIYDFSLGVPTPTVIIEQFNEVINRHAQLVWDDEGVPLPSNNDEAEVMAVLFGIGRLVEVNTRIAWETFANQEGLGEEASPRRYKDVLDLIDEYIENDAVHWLFKNARSITDGMVHGNFHQAYVLAQRAYERKDLVELTQSKFIQQTITTGALTAKGLNVHAKTGVATTTDGSPTTHKSFIPSKKNTIEDNFKSFYVAATFVPVYDILLLSFYRAYHYRSCISMAAKTGQT